MQANKAKRFIEFIIFNIRWALIPFYLVLGFDILILLYNFITQEEVSSKLVLHFVEHVDITMVANLMEMIITGSYNSFVSKQHQYTWKNISSGELKVKMGSSIVGISSIHLLRMFMETPELNSKIIIHCIFVGGAVFLAIINYLHVLSEKNEEANNHQPAANSNGTTDKLSPHPSPFKVEGKSVQTEGH